MARSKKYEKNLARVQSYLDGNPDKKIQHSTHIEENVHEGRKVGDIWTDSDGTKWEQKQGYRSKIGRAPEVGLFRHQCKDCKKNCKTSYDEATFRRMSRCYSCQITFENDLMGMKIGLDGNKHQFWTKLQALQRWESIDKEHEAYMLQKFDEDKKMFDKSVANALANAEIDTSIKVNKSLTK